MFTGSCIRNGNITEVSWTKLTTIMILTIVLFATTSESRTCSADNCKFGGKCETRIMYGRPGPKVCKCPSVRCYQGLYEPVCGSDGNTYFNVLCMIMEECERQKTIKPVCYGPCGSQLCEETKQTKSLHRSCSTTEQGYCKNGGLCYHHILLGQTRCKCNDRFEGRRCERRVLILPVASDNPQTNDCLIYKIGLALMTGLLLAITAYHLITCALRKKNREIKAKCTLWPKEKKSKGKLSLQDLEERKPLRSARSEEEYNSSKRPRVNGTSD